MDHLRQILTWANAERAIRKVVSNKGSAGVDGMKVTELMGYFRANWQEIKCSIGNGTYMPSAVLGKEIDKPNGGKRLLGIPTAVDLRGTANDFASAIATLQGRFLERQLRLHRGAQCAPSGIPWPGLR